VTNFPSDAKAMMLIVVLLTVLLFLPFDKLPQPRSP
jgi:hypothetical protein